MIRKAATLLFILGFLFIAAGTQFVKVSVANPFSQSAYSGERSPSIDVKPPVVSIIFPENNMVFDTNNVTLAFNVSVNSERVQLDSFHMITGMGIQKIFFTGDWLNETILVYHSPDIEDWKKGITKTYYMGEYRDNSSGINFSNLFVPLTNIPGGNHSVTVVATGSGSEYYIFNLYLFHVTGRASVNFTIKPDPPKVTLLSLENKTYETTDIALNFTVNEQTSHLAYSLDGKENVTLAGNTTITGLPDGAHSVTVYATDVAGNIGASETVYFSISAHKQFPVQVVVISSVAIVVAGVVLLVYFRKRNHKSYLFGHAENTAIS
ncbi:MAG: hypothetical protein QXU99_04755 [Candidatus Bathyarchaeia archaeon]